MIHVRYIFLSDTICTKYHNTIPCGKNKPPHGNQASSHALPPVGGRTAKEIVTWLNKRTGPPADVLETAEDAKAFTEKDDVVVVGFFEDAESDEAKAYTNAADTQDNIYFGIVTSKEVAESLDAIMDSVVVFKKFDDGRATFDKEFTTENIVTFVLGEQLPLVAKFSDEVHMCIIVTLIVWST